MQVPDKGPFKLEDCKEVELTGEEELLKCQFSFPHLIKFHKIERPDGDFFVTYSLGVEKFISKL